MVRRLSPFAAGIIATASSAFAGCYATAERPSVDYAETTAAPVEIETYPSVTYLGQPVYLYGDRWWYRRGGRWTYYRDEPAELRRQRDEVRARGPVRAVPGVEVDEERR
jgi:hypothetical protein